MKVRRPNLAVFSGLWIAFVAACSLGEGVTPECDPDADPQSDEACYQVSECDAGNGGIPAGNEQCCLARANIKYAQCAGGPEPDDFRTICDGSTDDSCCQTNSEGDDATSTFERCMDQGLTSSSSAGGSGGAGGAGGSGGSGGAAGGGGAMSGGGPPAGGGPSGGG